MTPRTRSWLKRLGIAVLAVLLIRPVAVVGIALYYGLDLRSYVEAQLYEMATFTIDPTRLSRAPYHDAVWVGNLENKELTEISGLAASRLRDDLLWGLNDSWNEPRLYAIGEDGRDLGSVTVDARNIDWEDLASFRWQGRSYLVIADVGDNSSWRPVVYLHFVPEPEVPAGGLPEGATAKVAWTHRFRYEGGPRDVEAVAIDGPARRVLLLDKRRVPANLYELELDPGRSTPEGDDEAMVARHVIEVPNIPQPTEDDLEEDPDYGKYRSEPTAMDINGDATAAVVLTYKDAYRFERATGESWALAFSSLPEVIPVPPLEISEALAFDRRGESIYASSEERPAPLFRFDRRAERDGR